MKQRSTYQNPTVKVVKVKSGGVLLLNSGLLQGYQYQQNTKDEGWEE